MRRERPCCCGSAEKCDERATFHSITSSARTSRDEGTVIPRVFAVLRLTDKSILVGNSTGRSPGRAPCRILSTKEGSKLPAALPAVFVHLLRSGDRAWLPRGTRAGRRLCHRGAHSHDLLFRVFLRDPAAAGTVRENQTGAELDFRIGAAAWCPRQRIGAATSGHAGVKSRKHEPKVGHPYPYGPRVPRLDTAFAKTSRLISGFETAGADNRSTLSRRCS
jgi:hypothetical protein